MAETTELVDERPLHQSRAGVRPTQRALGPLRLAVVLTVVAATVIGVAGLVDLFQVYDTRADHNSSLSYLDRAYGDVEATPPDLWPPRRVVEEALATMPENATYRILFGPEWRSSWETRWTDELTAGFLRFFLLPRAQSDSAAAPWVFCFACDTSELVGRFRVLSQSEDGLRFGRIER